VFVKTYSAGTYVATTSADVSIVASLAAAISTTVSPALSTAILNAEQILMQLQMRQLTLLQPLQLQFTEQLL